MTNNLHGYQSGIDPRLVAAIRAEAAEREEARVWTKVEDYTDFLVKWRPVFIQDDLWKRQGGDSYCRLRSTDTGGFETTPVERRETTRVIYV